MNRTNRKNDEVTRERVEDYEIALDGTHVEADNVREFVNKYHGLIRVEKTPHGWVSARVLQCHFNSSFHPTRT